MEVNVRPHASGGSAIVGALVSSASTGLSAGKWPWRHNTRCSIKFEIRAAESVKMLRVGVCIAECWLSHYDHHVVSSDHCYNLASKLRHK